VRRTITGYWLGRVAYERAHALQHALLEERLAGDPRGLGDLVLLLEHDPVVTLGRGANGENVLAGEEDLRARGVSLVETARGGDVTFHGPGQLVAYPILDLKPDRCDVRKYVRDLAEVMILLAREQGVAAGVLPGDPKFIGVWVDEAAPTVWDEARSLAASRGEVAEGVRPRLAKIGAIGVRLTRWLTMHGFAFNITTDLTGFRLIVPCGIQSLGVASLQTLGMRAALPAVEEVARLSLAHFEAVFDADVGFGDAATLCAAGP